MAENYKPWIKRIAQLGLISKAAVYILFGVLILLATYGAGQPVGFLESIKYIINLGWFGRFVVAVMAIGLFCYAGWKYFQMVHNVEGYSATRTGYFVRFTWLGPFLFHLTLGGHALVELYNWYFGHFHYYKGQVGQLQRFLYTPLGKWLIAGLAVTLFVNALTLFYLAFTRKYRLMLTGRQFHRDSPRLARITGFSGYITYGLALFITASLFAYSIYYSDVTYLQGQESMFHYLMIQPLGRILLSLIALGTVCYGLYFMLTAYYRWRTRPV